LDEPGWVRKSTRIYARLYGLSYREIQPIEPFQAVFVDASGINRPHCHEHVINRLWGGLYSCGNDRVVREHGLFILEANS
jgi:hypothetical protein